MRQFPPSTMTGRVGSRAWTARAARAISGSTSFDMPRFLELMNVISVSIDQMRIDGWFRSSRTWASSWRIQWSKRSRLSARPAR